MSEANSDIKAPKLEKVRDHLSAIQSLRQSRIEALFGATQQMETLVTTMRVLEGRIDQEIESFNSPGRMLPNRSLTAAWRIPDHRGEPFGLEGPYWTISRDVAGQARERVSFPQKRAHCEHAFTPSSLPFQMAARDRILQTKKAYAALRNGLKKIDAILSAYTPAPAIAREHRLQARLAADKSRWPREDMARAIKRLLEHSQSKTYALAFEMDWIDRRLDRLMQEFNSIHRRPRRGLLRCIWRIRGTRQERIAGPTGPEYNAIRGERGGKRMYVRLNTRGNILTKQAMRAHRIWGNKTGKRDAYLAVAREIESLRARRMDLAAIAKQLNKTLNTIHS